MELFSRIQENWIVLLIPVISSAFALWGFIAKEKMVRCLTWWWDQFMDRGSY